ncbi:MAG: 50S ribosomal protein L22 [Candidatus Gottesmanbacteria bacterium]
MEYQATAKYIRISTRKVRLVADSIRGLSVDKAIILLSMTPKAAVTPLLKLIRSAVANAKKTESEANTLMVKQLNVMGGPMMKRFHAVSRGMAHGYKKRMTHVHIVLEEKGAK